MLPFGGRYRLIDFTLSNMVNSGITGIGVYTGEKVRSVMDHLGSGGPWDLDRKINGLFIFTPTYNFNSPYQKIGDLELFHQNSAFIKNAKQDYILFSKSYMIANIDYNDAYEDFVASGADISIIYKRVDDPHSTYIGCEKLHLDENGQFDSLGINLGMESSFNLSLEMYFMKRSLYFEIIHEAIEKGNANFMKQAIFSYLNRIKVHTYAFKGDVFCINNIRNYFNANMAILNPKTSEDIFFRNGHIFTKVKDEPSTHYKSHSRVKNAFVANGCEIDGYVENSIIFRGVKIGKDCIIRNSIVMQQTHIESNAHLNYVVLDKRCDVHKGVTLVGDPSSPYVAAKKSRITKEGDA